MSQLHLGDDASVHPYLVSFSSHGEVVVMAADKNEAEERARQALREGELVLDTLFVNAKNMDDYRRLS